jgi:hypothetical protein
MFEKPWINWIHPDLKKRVLDAAERGDAVSYTGDSDSGMVILRRGPITVRGYDAKTGEMIMWN